MKRQKSTGPWYVYVERNKEKPDQVYTGSTNEPWRRARQHKGEISGGARTTRIWGKGNAEMVIVVGPFAGSLTEGRHFERLWKKNKIAGGMSGRIRTLCKLIGTHDGKVSHKLHLGAREDPVTVKTSLTRDQFMAFLLEDNPKGVLPTKYVDFHFEAVMPPPKPIPFK